VDGLEKAVSGDRRLRLHTARVTNGIMNAVGSMHQHPSGRTAGRTCMLSVNEEMLITKHQLCIPL